MQILSKINLKLAAIILPVTVLCLISIQQAHSQVVKDFSLNGNNLASSIANTLKPQIQNTIETTIQPYTNQVNTYISKIDNYQKEVDSYQKQLSAIPKTIEQQVDKSVSGVTRQVQDEIDNITVQVKNKLDDLKNEVNAAIKSSIQTLTWGMLGIDGLMTAVITWFVVRRVTRQLNKEIANLTNIISGLETQISQSVESVADGVRNQINTGITDSTSK
ncbi:hypothetical protein JOY44_29770 (plasmid) [Phormidium sp. CLA17]|uniref:hypothetical protein n=1 Tax=Leptolyngbya sp. Cla-17 TaxID=2803751 RepID=UPI00149256D4|nr:hypothetical protein [Leptolyngbya sp. Cla-17]MBM0745611.1 hypothetical protein [Leptolyngbya sp. Cla-17]